MDGVGDFDAMVLQEHTKIGELALSLGLSQAEARHENDLFGVHKLHGQIIGGSFFHGAFRTFASASGGIGTAETRLRARTAADGS